MSFLKLDRISFVLILFVTAILGVSGCFNGTLPPSPSPPPVPPTGTGSSDALLPSASVAQVDSGGKANTDQSTAWPTEAEAVATILKIEHAINASETNKSIWKVTDFRHEVKSVKFGQKTTQKQMHFGSDAITVYPVKILYTQITDYENKPSTRVEAGADGVWFLYRDSFGEWTGKYGNE